MMHSIPIRTMCLVVGMILLMVRDGICLDDNGMYANVGIGSDSCGRFVQEIQNSKGDVKLFHSHPYVHWIGGYLTSINLHTPNTFNILGRTDIDGAMLWIENYCNKNPLKNFTHAIEALVNELYPNRLTK